MLITNAFIKLTSDIHITETILNFERTYNDRKINEVKESNDFQPVLAERAARIRFACRIECEGTEVRDLRDPRGQSANDLSVSGCWSIPGDSQPAARPKSPPLVADLWTEKQLEKRCIIYNLSPLRVRRNGTRFQTHFRSALKIHLFATIRNPVGNEYRIIGIVWCSIQIDYYTATTTRLLQLVASWRATVHPLCFAACPECRSSGDFRTRAARPRNWQPDSTSLAADSLASTI